MILQSHLTNIVHRLTDTKPKDEKGTKQEYILTGASSVNIEPDAT